MYRQTLQRLSYRHIGLLNELNDLKLFGGGISHVPSSPFPSTLFFSARFSIITRAGISFSCEDFERSDLTSTEVVSRAVLPDRRFLPASKKLLRPPVVQFLADAFLSAQPSDALLTTQAFQPNPDLLLRRILSACRSANFSSRFLCAVL